MSKIEVDEKDFMYLISMCYGYIDDDLGGIEDNEHSKMFNHLIDKYDIEMPKIADQIY